MSAAHPDALRRRNRRGQTALEYVLVFLALFAAVCAVIHFMHAPGNVAAYTTDVICSERL